MNVGEVWTVRGVRYVVTSVRPDGEPCLVRLGSLVRVAGGGLLGQ